MSKERVPELIDSGRKKQDESRKTEHTKDKDRCVLYTAFKVLGTDTFTIHSKTVAKIFKAQK